MPSPPRATSAPLHDDPRFRDLVTPRAHGGEGMTPDEARRVIDLEAREDALIEEADALSSNSPRLDALRARIAAVAEEASAVYAAARARAVARRDDYARRGRKAAETRRARLSTAA